MGSVIKGKLRNVEGKNTLHHDVDDLFEQMFSLAADSGLLVYQSERSTGDTWSDSGPTQVAQVRQAEHRR